MKGEKMKKALTKICALIMTIALSFQILSVSVYAAPVSNETVVVTFTTEDVVDAAKAAYANGDLSKEDLNTVLSIAYSRLGIKGENKIVQVSSDTFDYYLNSLVWSIVTTLGTGAVGALLAYIPGLSAGVAGFIGTLVGGVSGSILSAENGVIIRVQMIDTSVGSATPNYVYRLISIREQ